MFKLNMNRRNPGILKAERNIFGYILVPRNIEEGGRKRTKEEVYKSE